MAHLLLVPNPAHHAEGDFYLQGTRVTPTADAQMAPARTRLTFSGIGVYSPQLFARRRDGRFPLAPLLRETMDQGLVSGECFRGFWMDIGSADRLAAAEQLFKVLVDRKSRKCLHHGA